MKPSTLRLWGWPVAWGLLTASGLLSALVSDTWGDVWSWLALGGPVLAMCFHGLVPPRRPRSSSSPPPRSPA